MEILKQVMVSRLIIRALPPKWGSGYPLPNFSSRPKRAPSKIFRFHYFALPLGIIILPNNILSAHQGRSTLFRFQVLESIDRFRGSCHLMSANHIGIEAVEPISMVWVSTDIRCAYE